MKNMVIAVSLLLLLPMAWAQGNSARPEKAQRQAARREMLKEQKPAEPPVREPLAQRRADLRAALLAKRPPEQQGDNNKHLTPNERMELRQQLRQQQMERLQVKGG